MKLVIAEKPDLASDIANAVLNDFALERNGIYKDDEYMVISAFGHLLTLAEPEKYDEKYKNWDINNLPIFFENWQRVPSKEDYKINRLNIIGDLLNDAECVIHAGDPDEEGQLLIDEILEYFNYARTVYRVYINDSVKTHIQKEFEKLKLNDDKMKAQGNSAYARQMADKAFGINETRLCALRLKQKGISIGRVQTPTLGLIVNRDAAIANHTKEKYYDLKVTLALNEDVFIDCAFKPNKNILKDSQHISDKDEITLIKQNMENYQDVCTCNEIAETVNPPLPFNQTELSIEMSKKYNYSLKKTLEITQNLRDKHKAITYNRSDCQYLSEDHYKEAPEVIEQVLKNLNASYPIDFSIKSRCFNDNNITAHHGIIPSCKSQNSEEFNDEERNVYEAICNRYLMQFLPPMRKKISEIKIDFEMGSLTYRGIEILTYGFQSYFDYDKATITNKGYIPAGDYKCAYKDAKIEEKETRPLTRYTPGTLVKDMCGISKYVKDPEIKRILKEKDKEKKGENGSIGTVATRASIIETLESRGFIRTEGKFIESTELGKQFYNVLPEEIKVPDITAKWWIIQEDVKKGLLNPNALLDEVVKDFESRKNDSYKDVSGLPVQTLSTVGGTERVIGKCPKCGNNVYEGKMKNGDPMYYCGNKSCTFALFYKMKFFGNELKITKAKASQLLASRAKFKLISKKNTEYEGYLKLSIQGKYVNFIFDDFVKKRK